MQLHTAKVEEEAPLTGILGLIYTRDFHLFYLRMLVIWIYGLRFMFFFFTVYDTVEDFWVFFSLFLCSGDFGFPWDF